MIIIAIILLIFSISLFVDVILYKNSKEDSLINESFISEELMEKATRIFAGIFSLSGILCALYIIFL